MRFKEKRLVNISDYIRHEDGSVQFWDVTDTSMPLVYKLKTSDYFQIEQAPIDEMDEETWPPFRKVRRTSEDLCNRNFF